jgi:beta-glucosidase
VEEVLAIARAVPTVLQAFLDRPAILTPFVADAAAIAADFGADQHALLDVLFGAASPRGRLPMELPSSMEAVRASRPDVPFDTEAPLFRFGHGLGY